ncbi:MAG: DUF1801 domain-containing protein [Saprospiraceae bacterium]
MNQLIINQNLAINNKFEAYPKHIQPKIQFLRKLILETAAENDVSTIEETLKWNEPSYLVKKGSTIRIDWKSKMPNQYAMYFKCTSRLVPTFKEVFGDLFNYENNRAILFALEDEIPEKELKECIRLALQYHSLKKLPKLGM